MKFDRSVFIALLLCVVFPLVSNADQLEDANAAIENKDYEKALELFRSKSACNQNDSAVRVLMTGVPIVHGAERVLEIIESNGGLVVCMDNCTGLKPILEDVEEETDEPVVALAEKYLHLPWPALRK